jgi:ribose transport system permease protein
MIITNDEPSRTRILLHFLRQGVSGARHGAMRGSLVVLLVLMCVVLSVMQPAFMSLDNAIDMWRTASIAAIMYVGLTWVIASGEIDVSFMDVAALASMVFAVVANAHFSPLFAAILAIVAGLGIGLCNGVMVGLLGFPSLIVTIASGTFAHSVATILGHGQPVYLDSSGVVGTFVNGAVAGLPLIGIVAVLLYVLSWFLQERLVIGHHVYVLAQNGMALRQVGVRTQWIKFGLFVVTGVMSAAAGVVLAGTLNSGNPMIGGSFFLDGLTAVFLGATVIRLGQPNIIGTGLGVIILAVLVNGMALVGAPNFAREIIKGVLLLLGVIVAVKAGNLRWTGFRRLRAAEPPPADGDQTKLRRFTA